ncbi:MAG: aminotransferase class I/II-fold pyridoxal phosphate-dependent enzyme [Candidatus Planktophila sp.]|nr:aminotransferase class I/II-fold pyridoxal phosphate-dependent enzyme [Candidatus Planktophila sp.]
MSDHLVSAPNLSELQTHRSAKWRDFDPDVLPLPVAEMDYPVAQPIRDVLAEMVAKSDLGYLGAIPELGKGFAHFASKRWNWEVDQSQVRAATDVGVAVVEILRVFTKPGDSILLNSPVYHNFYNWINETKLNLVDVPFERTGDESANPWEINWDQIEKAYASGIKVHLLCTPHNPLGRIYSKEELLRLVELAKRFNVLIISDEIHAPLTYKGNTFVPILSLGSDAESVAVTVTAASKAWNIAGLKCAIIVSQNQALNQRLATMPLAVHYRASLLGGFATAVAFAEGELWLDSVLENLDHNRFMIKELLASQLPSVRYHIPDNSYLAWLDVEALNLGEDPTATLIKKGKVAFNAGHTFGKQCSQYVRLNFATSPTIITEAIHRISRAI